MLSHHRKKTLKIKLTGLSKNKKSMPQNYSPPKKKKMTLNYSMLKHINKKIRKADRVSEKFLLTMIWEVNGLWKKIKKKRFDLCLADHCAVFLQRMDVGKCFGRFQRINGLKTSSCC